MKDYIIHQIDCTCVLQIKNNPKFRFKVFSVLNDDKVQQKFVTCPNCGVTHKVNEVGKSNILRSKEDLKSILKIDDIKKSLNQKFIDILEENNCDITIWEQTKFIIENEMWGRHVYLMNDFVDDMNIVKIMKIIGTNLFTVDNLEFESVIKND